MDRILGLLVGSKRTSSALHVRENVTNTNGGNDSSMRSAGGNCWAIVMKEAIKAVMISLISFVFMSSCGFSAGMRHGVTAAFIEGDICIVPPVQLVKERKGLVRETHYNDGGTIMITIIDVKGKSFDVYIDHRIGEYGGTIYLNGYPDTNRSIRIRNQVEFKNKILRNLGSVLTKSWGI